MRRRTMLDYVADTPDVLRAQVAGDVERPLVTALTAAARPRVLRIVATGSSANAALCARQHLRRALGVEVLVTDPHSFVLHEAELPPDEFVVCISQSGYSGAVLDALDAVCASGRPAIGVTGDTGSDVADHCDVLVDYGVGPESVGYSTKGVSALHAFLCLVGDTAAEHLGSAAPGHRTFRDSLPEYLQTFETTLAATHDVLREHVKDLTSMGPVVVCGSGPDFGVAREGALKFGETIQVPASGVELEEFLHGPHLQLTPQHTVVLLATGAASWRRARELHRAVQIVTDRVHLITDDPGADARPGRDVQTAPATSPSATAPAVLPFFQVLAHEVTDRLHRWHKHPLLVPFEAAISGKTENYVDKEVV